MDFICFNKPAVLGDECDYLKQVLTNSKLCGNGPFTKLCQTFFEEKFGFKKCLLTTSCTDALEMAALLINIKEGDEVIVPSYTFVSSALAFVRQGATVVFADSDNSNPNIDVYQIEKLITPRTKAIVPVHYAGVAVDMDELMCLAKKYNLWVIEDAAQAIGAYYKDRPLGGIGHFGCFSFHETKNITAGEGGMLVVNDESFIKRSEIIWEKGTNRSEFFRGEINKYGWVDTGSSFLPSELNAALLYSQLQNLDIIQERRISLWERYAEGLHCLVESGLIELLNIPDYATNNAHMFYLLCKSIEQRDALITFLRSNRIQAVFHYLSLHTSIYSNAHSMNIRELPNADRYSDCLVRLPLFYSLTMNEVDFVTEKLKEFFLKK